MVNNKMRIQFDAKSQNESFARSVIACFVLQLNPSIAEVSDIKTAVSEAVTNSIVHGYKNSQSGEITMEATLGQDVIHINIYDNGIGINDVDKALEPFYTTCPEDERSGMGFSIMQSFMDEVKVVTKKGCGTKVYMAKKIKTNA